MTMVQQGETGMPGSVAHWADELETADPQAICAWAVSAFGSHVALASSFGVEDMCLTDMLVRATPTPRVFYLDTGVLFPETYALVDAVKARYGFVPERRRPALTLALQADQYGDRLWQRDPDACCRMRKVEPLGQMLNGLDAWITGIRRDQTPFRAGARVVEVDAKFGLIKINPLVRWTTGQVWRYVRQHRVPYNRLHHQGYPSIGCVPCTRAVRAGEDPRAGRWATLDKTECGIHPGAAPLV
ncbi:MAG: phosphoadenylyl-sulfate reductase [Thermaerobacter sp.]|nr:phosphoadenylyl-sulfate reductase [Thermaerobacter sp.]